MEEPGLNKALGYLVSEMRGMGKVKHRRIASLTGQPVYSLATTPQSRIYINENPNRFSTTLLIRVRSSMRRLVRARWSALRLRPRCCEHHLGNAAVLGALRPRRRYSTKRRILEGLLDRYAATWSFDRCRIFAACPSHGHTSLCLRQRGGAWSRWMPCLRISGVRSS